MDLVDQLSRILPEGRVLGRAIDRIAFANDASVYRLVPRAVVTPGTLQEVRRILAFSRKHRIPLTFRAAGTSLSGQAVTDGLLVVVSRHWREIEVLDEGLRVRVQPGAVGGLVNRHLRPFGRKIGPDPASINACMIGGILANNSSGMCCGVEQNAYRTLQSIRFVLPDGVVVDTADDDCEARLNEQSPQLCRDLSMLRDRVIDDPALVARIRAKYRLKNTMGYSINALIDYESPAQILAHLMIGSEGTLGFIAEAILHTVEDPLHRYTGLLFFEDVPAACATIEPLRRSGARALELMDRASLRAVQDQPGMPPVIRELGPTAAGLLVEYQHDSTRQLSEARERANELVSTLKLAAAPDFTDDATRQAEMWRVRKGLIPSVGAMRKAGTSFIIEDVVFPVERLARGVADLQGLFARHGYDDAIVFGHAKDGNLHFVLTQAFEDRADVSRYDAFMRDLAELVAGRYDGALKAEHGTGRNMAPFVEAEWGSAAYRVMRAVKSIVDPDGLLNPGVLLNDDPRAHVTDLKSLPAVEQEVNDCIECGFCESSCPSRDLTLTPRQRIVVRREMARLRREEPGSPTLRELERDWDYAALATCATDGLCSLSCPVGIDTGKLTRRLRGEARSDTMQELAVLATSRFAWLEQGARLGLRVARRFDSKLPVPAAALPASAGRDEATGILFASCVNRVAAPADSRDAPLVTTILDVCAEADKPLWLPGDIRGHCCGLAAGSKGLERASQAALDRTLQALWRWSDAGRLPVVVDSSPCALTLKQAASELTILDGIEFAHDELLPRIPASSPSGSAVVHPVCSARKSGLTEKLTAIVASRAESVDVPLTAGCCGFAGDRGLRYPELARAATLDEREELKRRGAYDGYYSSSSSCEMGLRRTAGLPFRSFWHLLRES